MLNKLTGILGAGLIFLHPNLFAAGIESIGVPYVQNYTKAAYQSGNQNWSVTKDEHGIMYFGNAEGLLSFDGRYWQLHTLPEKQIVRSVAADGKGRIYTGGFGELGYWQSAKGLLIYHSLLQLIPKAQLPNEEIWKIYADGEDIYFQSFGSIFILHQGKIRVIRASHPFLFLFKAGSRLFTEQVGVGLFELKNTKLYPIANSVLLSNSGGIMSILPCRHNQFLIGTARGGLFIYDGRQITAWSIPANDFLKANQLNNGAIVSDKYYAYGTILNGIVIIDTAGKIVQHINKSSGLQNNTVLNLYTDSEQNLWAGLDNGIDRIEVNSPLHFYLDKTGRFGTVYSSIIFKGKIYLGTNQGLFYSDWSKSVASGLFQPVDFKLIPGSQGQVWDLSLQDNRLLCGHNDGTFEVDDGTIHKISAVNGGWLVKKLKNNLLIQGTYTGLVIYKKDAAGRWIFSHKIQGFTEPCRYIEQDDKEQIWVSHAYKGLYKIKLSDDLRKAVAVKYYDNHHGLPGSYHINIFSLDNHIVFSSDAGFYTYDEITDRFYLYQQLNKMLKSFAASNKIIPAYGKKYWFINHGKVALTNLAVPGRLSIDSNQFNILNGRMVQHYENISRISNLVYLISVDDGFVIFNDQGNTSSPLKLPGVLIRKIENTTDTITTITDNGTPANLNIAAQKNNIRITYALPYHGQVQPKYQYYLEGYTDHWSEWTTQSQREFTNLNQGDYTFKVRAKLNESISKVTSFTFTILPPWYAGKIARAVYMILVLITAYLLRLLYSANIRRHQLQIQQKIAAENDAYLKQQAAAKEQEIIRIRNEQLQLQLASKSRELTGSAMNIVSKNELLQKLRTEITDLKDSAGKKFPADQLRKIYRVIDEGLTNEQDWNLFENTFNETHENFFKKLKSQHPDLVPNDLKLCAYLRMNMSSKEMASMLNISLRGIEIRRYRLRKKLDIAHDKNLNEFLIEL